MNALIRCRERRQASVQKEITNEWTVLNINITNASHKAPVSWKDTLCCVREPFKNVLADFVR